MPCCAVAQVFGTASSVVRTGDPMTDDEHACVNLHLSVAMMPHENPRLSFCSPRQFVSYSGIPDWANRSSLPSHPNANPSTSAPSLVCSLAGLEVGLRHTYFSVSNTVRYCRLCRHACNCSDLPSRLVIQREGFVYGVIGSHSRQ